MHPLRPCQVGFANGSPSGFWSKTRSRKPTWKKGCSSAMYLLKDQSSTDQGEVIPETPRMSKLASSSPWEPAKPHDEACFWERIEALLPPLRPRPKCDFIHPRQLSPFPERLVLPFSQHTTLTTTTHTTTTHTNTQQHQRQEQQHSVAIFWLKFVVNAHPHLLRAWVSDLRHLVQVSEVHSDLTGDRRI